MPPELGEDGIGGFCPEGIINLIDRQIGRSNFLAESSLDAIENASNEESHVNRNC